MASITSLSSETLFIIYASPTRLEALSLALSTPALPHTIITYSEEDRFNFVLHDLHKDRISSSPNKAITVLALIHHVAMPSERGFKKEL